MPQDRRPEPKPFTLEGGSTGCLLIHGFTGSPPEMRPVGDYLNQRGLTVHAPLLAGHGTQPSDLNQVTWQDWLASAEEGYKFLRERTERIYVAGLSMGTLIAALICELHPRVLALAAYSPALVVANPFIWLAPLLKYIVRTLPASAESDLVDPEAPDRLWGYGVWPVSGVAQLYRLQGVLRRSLPQLSTPAIVFRSTRDRTIHEKSGRLYHDLLGSDDKKLVTVHNSGHCMTVDAEREEICAETWRFFQSQADKSR